ncbi:MAG TPA: DUF1080 domain-containing protein [Verrucomicrobiales bacterium]|nr:DUF1080 domain-containing protein [Verrucomicrobiales bacterium]
MKSKMLLRCLPAGLAMVLIAGAGSSGLLGAEEESGEGWVDLLEEHPRKHWTTTGNWSFEGGTVTLTPREGEQGWSRWTAYLWSKKVYGDFEITFEYRLEKGGNSGFYFRVGDVDDPVAKGIEVQIYDSASVPADRPLNDHDSGGVIPGVAPAKRAAKPPGEWNRFHITNRDGKLTVVLNGETVNEIDLSKEPLSSRPAEGNIGFQDHALPISLRNIRIRPVED